MLTWYVTYHCKKGQREAFYQALCELGVREYSRGEYGNIRYDYFFAAEHPWILIFPRSRRRRLPSLNASIKEKMEEEKP